MPPDWGEAPPIERHIAFRGGDSELCVNSRLI